MSTTETDALERALVTMGLSPEEAKFRLRDILVEEVSVVDRAANTRRFIMVKNAGGDMPGETNPQGQGDQPQPNADGSEPELVLAKGVKDELLGVLTQNLEKMVAVTELVKAATESDDAPGDDYALPSELALGMLTASETLRGSLVKYRTPQPDGLSDHAKALRALSDVAFTLSKSETVDAGALGGIAKAALALVKPVAKNQALAMALQEVAEVAMVMAQMAAQLEEGADMPEDMMTTMVQLAERLMELAGGDAGDGDGDADATEGGDMEDKTSGGGDGQPEGDDGLMKNVATISEAYAEIGKRGAKMSAARRKKLKEALKTLQGGFQQIMALLDEVEPSDKKNQKKRAVAGQPRNPNEGEGGDLGNVGTGPDDDTPGGAQDDEVIGDVMKRLDALQTQVAKLAERPAPPASSPEPPEGTNGNGDHQPRKRRGGPWIM